MQHLLAAHSLPEKQRLFSNSADFIHWEQIRGGDGRLALVMTRNTVEGSEGNIGWRVAESNWQGGHLLSLFVFPFEGPLTTNLFKKNLYPRHRPVAQGTATAANLRPQSWKTMKPMFFRREAVRWQRSTRSTPGSSRWTRSTVRWSGRHGPGRGVGGTPPPDVSNSSSSQ